MVDEDGKTGPGLNHERCYRWLSDYTDAPWSVILEDDAVPVRNFRNQLSAVLRSAPDTGLMSLYLGRYRPPHYQPSIARVIATDNHFLLAQELLHHVAVVIRTELIPEMLTFIRADGDYRRKKLPIDEAIGLWQRSRGQPVVYCHPSIVNHDTNLRTVIDRHVSRHKGETGRRPHVEVRQAWAFGVRQDWSGDRVAEIPEPV